MIEEQTDKKSWDQWEKEESKNLELIKEIQTKGHSRHCACRQVWGDGECSCSKDSQDKEDIANKL